MKLFFISAVLCFNLTFTQTVYESIESNALGVKRELKIQLPRNYESNPDKNYPLIVVFDGDYLFEVVASISLKLCRNFFAFRLSTDHIRLSEYKFLIVK